MAEVLVYRLIEPSVLTKRADIIRTHLITNAGPQVEETAFYMSTVSGCFKWFARPLHVVGARPPKSADEAMRAAAKFFAAVNGAAAEYRFRNHIEIAEYPDPFPLSTLRHVTSHEVHGETAMSSRPVLLATQRENKFWRSVWMLFLRVESLISTTTTPTRHVPVHGATVEVVIGSGGLIESVISTVRPWVSIRRVSAFSPPRDQHSSGHDHRTADLVYVADGVDEPQTFFAPFYLSTEAVYEHPHGTSLLPACTYALIIDLIVLQDSEGARIVPVVMDRDGEMIPANPGDFIFSWLYARIEETINGKFRRSTAPDLQIKAIGMFHIELIVEHRATGAVRSTYRQIPLGGHERNASIRGVS